MPHKRDIAADFEKFHAYCSTTLLPGTAGPSGFQTVPIDTDLSFFFRPYQRFTTPREKKTPENMLVKMPKQ
jgi:hypothetical protein